MHQKIQGSVIPKQGSPLYREILSCARRRWQKNKVLTLLRNGHVSNKIEQRNRTYDYNLSLGNVLVRIMHTLDTTQRYGLDYIKIDKNIYYYLVEV